MDYRIYGPVLTYRPIRHSDIGLVMDAFCDWPRAGDKRPWGHQRSINACAQLAHLQQFVELPLTLSSMHQECLVAIDPGGEPVGISISRCVGFHVHARNQAVVPHARGKGYWSALVDDLMTAAFRAHGARLITFGLWHGDSAADHLITTRALERDGGPAPGEEAGREVQAVRITRDAFEASGRATAVTWVGIS